MSQSLLLYYEAIEQVSNDILKAAQNGDWEEITRLEIVFLLLLRQLKEIARECPLTAEEAEKKSQIMQRISSNDAEVRKLVEPYLLNNLNQMLPVNPGTLH